MRTHAGVQSNTCTSTQSAELTHAHWHGSNYSHVF